MAVPSTEFSFSESLKLWSVHQVVNNQGGCGGVYLHLLELLVQQSRLDCVKGTGEIKDYIPQSAGCFERVSAG